MSEYHENSININKNDKHDKDDKDDKQLTPSSTELLTDNDHSDEYNMDTNSNGTQSNDSGTTYSQASESLANRTLPSSGKNDDNENNRNNKDLQMNDSPKANLGGSNDIKTEWGDITEPDWKTIFVRSKQYLQNQRKQKTQSVLFPLVHCECFKIEERIDHIAKHPSSWYYQNVDPKDSSVFFIIMQLQVASIQATMITYHCLKCEMNPYPQTTDETFNKLFKKFLESTDEYRSQRLKLIPRIADGPYPVKKVVENKPVLIATKVKHRYFKGHNYIEIDGQVDESMLTQSILKLCYRFSKRIIVDIAWVIQGEREDELPERVMAAVCFHHVDFNKIQPIGSNRNDIDEDQKSE